MTTFTWGTVLSLDSPWAFQIVSDERDVDDLVRERLWPQPRKMIPWDPYTVIRIIRGKRCTTLQATLQEWAAALQFPWYFGHNWDAFDECLSDLDNWLPGSAYVLFVTHADQVLADEPEQFRTMVNILASAAEQWRIADRANVPQPALPFRVMFHVQPDRSDALDRRLSDTGYEIETRRIDSAFRQSDRIRVP